MSIVNAAYKLCVYERCAIVYWYRAFANEHRVLVFMFVLYVSSLC
jgi:hypothetical protein